MKVFDLYARYYDLLYSSKDYKEEAGFVARHLNLGGIKTGEILELGCGTGRHAIEFVEMGWGVTGVDVSDSMITQARKRFRDHKSFVNGRLNFGVGDARTYRDQKQYDAVVSLFHVISYQNTNSDLEAQIATAAHHLNRGGLFVFDFWYGPAVLTDPPVVRVKRMGDSDLEVTRLAVPSIDTEKNIVSVDYQLFLRNRNTNEVTEIGELHSMRYMFLPELEFLLNRAGFELRTTGKWCSDLPASKTSWYVFAVAVKK